MTNTPEYLPIKELQGIRKYKSASLRRHLRNPHIKESSFTKSYYCKTYRVWMVNVEEYVNFKPRPRGRNWKKDQS